MLVWSAPCVKSVGLSVVMLGVLVGCGGGGDGFNGPRGQVSGTVTFQDKPIPEGSVVMFQAKSGSTYLATGTVKADGKYTLVYRGKSELPAVSYLVQIAPPAPTVANSDPKASADPAKGVKGDPKKLAEAAKPPFPAKYAASTTSKLSFDVKAGPNTADFKLTE